MKIQQVCDSLKVDRYTVYHLLHLGKLTGYHGAKWEISIKDLADYIKRNPTTTQAPIDLNELAVWKRGIR